MQPTPYPRRKRRADSFFGLHFDCHLTETCRQVGKDLMPQDIAKLIKIARPDYIHCDCKGHPGVSSYPTKKGCPAPQFSKDPLRLWREVTAKYGVALYAHYCGLWSAAQVKQNPSWGCVQADGKGSTTINSFFGPYVDRVLIPQMRELIEDYDLDGVWVDGDCWSALPEYGKSVLQMFRRATGIKNVPRKPQDKGFFEFMEFCREGFRSYLARYVDAVHAMRPDFQICCNWAYSSFMPEPVKIDVDFLSGDYPPLNSVNHGRWEARCLVHQDMPWDLVIWGIANAAGGVVSTKSAVQLEQQAAIPIALGGGVTFYFFQPKRDASLNRWEFELIGEIAQFCKARQKVCHTIQPLPQIALLYSAYDYYHRNDRLFVPRDPLLPATTDLLTPARATLQCLLESQHVVDVLMEHHLEKKLKDYPLLVVPEIQYLCPETKQLLLEYAAAGGNLLVVGSQTCRFFEKELKIRSQGETVGESRWLEMDEFLCAIKGVLQVKLLKGANGFGRIFKENDIAPKSLPAASWTRYGKGRIGGIYFDLGTVFSYAAAPTMRNILKAAVDTLFPDPVVRVTGSHYVDVTAGWKNDSLVINLVNTAGPHADLQTAVFDEIPAIGPLAITVKVKRKPRRVSIGPDWKPAEYVYKGGKIFIPCRQLAIHQVIVIES